MLLVGIMLACAMTAVTTLSIGYLRACCLSVAVFALWIVGIFLFWWCAVNRDSVTTGTGEASSNKEKDTETKKEEAGGWQSKVKAKTDRRLPVTIITGFLGSGKTTLVKGILNNTVGMKVLVIENEIGSEGIDHELLMQHTVKEDIVLMNNGCVCCTVRKDLLGTFHRIFENEAFARLDWVIIETTGLADPAPLIQSLYIDEKCKSKMRLDGVVTVVDCKHFATHLLSGKRGQEGQGVGAHGGISEVYLQVAFADRILVNKADLLPHDGLEGVVQSIRLINSHAKLIVCQQSKVPVDELLNIRAFDASRNCALLESLRDQHDYEIKDDRPILIRRDGAGKITSSKLNFHSGGENNSKGGGRKGISTVSLTSDLPLDLDLFNEWIAKVLRTQGEQIYRTKGILWMDKYNHQFVAQGVHMIFDGERGPVWADGDGRRHSRLVFIGLNLDFAQLQNEFCACAAALG